MPHNLNALKQEFYDIAMMPNTIGAIDGTHVAITGLSKDIEHVYVNRKGWVHNFKYASIKTIFSTDCLLITLQVYKCVHIRTSQCKNQCLYLIKEF